MRKEERVGEGEDCSSEWRALDHVLLYYPVSLTVANMRGEEEDLQRLSV